MAGHRILMTRSSGGSKEDFKVTEPENRLPDIFADGAEPTI